VAEEGEAVEGVAEVGVAAEQGGCGGGIGA